LFNHLKTGQCQHYKGLVYLGRNLVYFSGLKTFNPALDKHENIRPKKVKKQGRRAYRFFKYELIRIAYAILNALDIKEFDDCIKVLSST
jgi:hypothetical protein